MVHKRESLSCQRRTFELKRKARGFGITRLVSDSWRNTDSISLSKTSGRFPWFSEDLSGRMKLKSVPILCHLIGSSTQEEKVVQLKATIWLGPWRVGQPGLTLNSLSYSCQALILVVQSTFRGSIFLLLVNMNFFFSKNPTPGARIITQEKSGLWWKWWVNGRRGRVALLRENISFLRSANFETVMVSSFLPPGSPTGSSFH